MTLLNFLLLKSSREVYQNDKDEPFCSYKALEVVTKLWWSKSNFQQSSSFFFSSIPMVKLRSGMGNDSHLCDACFLSEQCVKDSYKVQIFIRLFVKPLSLESRSIALLWHNAKVLALSKMLTLTGYNQNFFIINLILMKLGQ